MNGLDAADNPAYFTAVENRYIDTLWSGDTKTLHIPGLTGTHNLDFVTLAQGAVLDTYQRYYAQIVIEIGVDDQGLQRGIRIAVWSWNGLHQTLKHILNANAGLG